MADFLIQRVQDLLIIFRKESRHDWFKHARQSPPRAYLNEGLLRPALERYQGHFYQVARERIREACGRGIHILIISGGYGALLPEEPIGNYEAAFSPNWWPKGLLSDVVRAYAAQHKISSVRAFVAASTTYRKAVASIDWSAAGINDVVVVSPQVSGGGAMIKSPRAQAQAFCAALDGELADDWAIPDGIPVCAVSLSKQ
jgi:cytoplasmic iron level regulating protein YaaA (DUF328/UPF0246 family)